LPKADEVEYPENLVRFDAVRLFAERARAADRTFELSRGTAVTVARICRRLDGIPFAIELAASRVNAVGLADIAGLAEDRLNTSTSAYRSSPQRHRSLHALIDWSFGLLTSDEQLLLTRLSSFPGYWTADAASVVCRFGPLESTDILELVLSLVDKSLVVIEVVSNRARYRLLESTRQFLLAKPASPSEGITVEKRIAHWVAEFSDRSQERLDTTTRAEWLPSMADELDNARASLGWALGPNVDIGLVARIIAGYRSYWNEEGLFSEGVRWTTRALRSFGSGGDLVAEASLWHSMSVLTSGARCVDASNEAIARLQRLGDVEGLAGVYLRLSHGYRQLAQFEEAKAASDRALSLFSHAGRTRTIRYASALGLRAIALVGLGRYAEAREDFAADISLIESLGDGERAAVERLNLAELEFADGRIADALTNLEKALQTIRGRHSNAKAAALLNGAAYRIVLGDLRAAYEAASEVLELTRLIGYSSWKALAVQHLATIAALEGDARRAASLVGYVDACLAREGVAREPTELRTFEILNARLEKQLGADERADLEAAGRALSESDAIDLALVVQSD
jgi:tetratricopeptide (TPR) repeat protein